MESMQGLWPGEIASYDGASRTCQVRILGITDGSNGLPEAVFNNPLGDDASTTEIRILPDAPVWLMFECGDPRYPIIMGYRTPRAGNPVDWRRWQHNNIEITADNELIINAASVTWNITGNETKTVGGVMASTAGSSTHEAATHAITAQTSIAGAVSMTAGAGGSGASIQGAVAITGASLTHNGNNVGSSHTHTEQGDGAEVSAPH